MTRKHEMILIVDDEPDMCWALERILRGMGFATETVGDAQKALGLVKRTRFRLAFLDAKLPDMEGIDLAICLQKAIPPVPVVLVSAYFYEDDAQVQQWIRDGFICHFVSKPFVINRVREAAAMAIN
ncbi:response regulator [Candidatus Poribacteria bacterium]|nr:response regulator [Candidatus Poribacteria bacterium]